MSLLAFSAICAAAFATLQFVVIPLLRRSIKNASDRPPISRCAWLGIARYVRTAALLAAATTAGVAGGVSLLRIVAQPAMTQDAVRAAMERQSDLRDLLGSAFPLWFGAATAALAVGIGIAIFRRRKMQTEAAFAAASQHEVERLLEEMRSDPTWWDLPPSKEMVEVLNEIHRLKSVAQTQPQLASRIDQSVGQLSDLYLRLDIRRRMEVRIDPLAIDGPEPENWRERLAGLFSSRLTLGAVGFGTRTLYRLNFVLLILGLIGFQAPLVKSAVDERLVELEDLRVQIVRIDELAAEVAAATKEVEDPEEGERLAQTALSIEELARQSPPSPPRTPAPTAIVAEAEQLRAKIEDLSARKAAIDTTIEEANRIRSESASPSERPSRSRLAEVEGRLKQVPDLTGETNALRREAIALRERVAASTAPPEPDSRRASTEELRSELQRVEAERAERLGELERRLATVEELPGREEELRRLRETVDRLAEKSTASVADARTRLDGVDASIVETEAARQSEVDSRKAALTDTASFAERAVTDTATLAAAEENRPARVEEGRSNIAAAEARLDAADAESAWKTARPAETTSAQPLDAEAEAAIRRTARAFETRLAESDAIRAAIPEVDAETDYRLRSQAARSAVIRRAQEIAPSERTRSVSMSEVPTLSEAEKLVAADVERILDPDPVRTEAGRLVEKELREAAQASSAVRDRIVEKAPPAAGWWSRVKSSFADGGFRRTMREFAFSAMNLAASSTVGPDVASPLLESAREAYLAREQANAYRYAADVIGDKSVDQALQDIRLEVPDRPSAPIEDYVRDATRSRPSPVDVAERLQPFEPALDVPSFERGTEGRKAMEILERSIDRLPAEYRVRAADVLSEPISSFADYFPSQAGQDLATPRGQLVERFRTPDSSPLAPRYELPNYGEEPPGVGSGNGGGPPPKTQPPGRTTPSRAPPTARPSSMPSRSMASVSRARSFVRLRGFARIGGVLIGRDASGTGEGESLDLVDLQWEMEGDAVRLILTDAEGGVHRSRSFDRDVAQLALAYAADGRPTAVTMVTAQPLQELRILLHPALVDSQVGRHVIDVDRLVDKHTGSSFWRAESALFVKDVVQLYDYARAVRLCVLLEQIDAEEARDALAATESRLEETRAKMADELAAVLQSEALHDPDSAPLGKKEFFDESLVSAIRKAAGPAATLTDFEASIRAQAKQELDDAAAAATPYEGFGLSGREKVESLVTRWQYPAPEFVFWSGVREVEFQASLDDCFVREGAELPETLDFMFQVAFTSPPYFLSGLPSDDEAAAERLESWSDTEPWEFPVIKERIRSSVREALDLPDNEEDRTTHRAVSEFTILQRLFRLGFAGRLGKDFPVELLAELHRALSEIPAPMARTYRWNSREGLLQLALGRAVSDQLDPSSGAIAVASSDQVQALEKCGELLDAYEERLTKRDEDLRKIWSESTSPQTDPTTLRRCEEAWDQFEREDIAWEKSLTEAVAALAATQPLRFGILEEAASDPFDSFVGEAEAVVQAIELRRALDVAADDRQQALEALSRLSAEEAADVASEAGMEMDDGPENAVDSEPSTDEDDQPRREP